MINDKVNYEKILYVREIVTKKCFNEKDFVDVNEYDFYGKTGTMHNCIKGEIGGKTFVFYFGKYDKIKRIKVEDDVSEYYYSDFANDIDFRTSLEVKEILDNLSAEELAKIILNIPKVNRREEEERLAKLAKEQKHEEEIKRKIQKTINLSKSFLKKQLKKNGLDVDIEKVAFNLRYDLGKMFGYYFY